MINNQLKGLSATKLKLILMAAMLLLIALSCVGFLYFRSLLIDYSNQVSTDNAVATESTKEVAQLKKLKGELENDKVAVARAQKIVADSTHYQYQNQIIDDISAYAKTAGVTITGFSFGGDDESTSQASPTAASPTIAGLNSTQASISIKSPVSYKAIMDFVYSIESNLTKMQLTGISLSKNTNDNRVIVNPISIKVYTR